MTYRIVRVRIPSYPEYYNLYRGKAFVGVFRSLRAVMVWLRAAGV
jgi:hypothetical protein